MSVTDVEADENIEFSAETSSLIQPHYLVEPS